MTMHTATFSQHNTRAQQHHPGVGHVFGATSTTWGSTEALSNSSANGASTNNKITLSKHSNFRVITIGASQAFDEKENISSSMLHNGQFYSASKVRNLSSKGGVQYITGGVLGSTVTNGFSSSNTTLSTKSTRAFDVHQDEPSNENVDSSSMINTSHVLHQQSTKTWLSMQQQQPVSQSNEHDDDQMSTTSSFMDDDDSDYIDEDEYLAEEYDEDDEDATEEEDLAQSTHYDHSAGDASSQVLDDSHESENLVWPVVNNPCQDCSEYTSHIIALMRRKEAEKRPSPTYLDALQEDINQQMRSILVDWLVDVAQEFQLENNTIHLAVNYTDRFLSLNAVKRDRLQLCGVTALLIASKYNEKQPPCVDDFVYITDHTYTREQLLFMESTMLNSLDFSMTVVTQLDFMEHFLRVSQAPPRDSAEYRYVLSLVQYLSELTLHEYTLLKYAPSCLISACIIVALHTLNIPSWTPRMHTYLQYSAQDLSEAVNKVYQSYCYQCYQQNSLHALRDKYSSEAFGKIALQAPRADNPLLELM